MSINNNFFQIFLSDCDLLPPPILLEMAEVIRNLFPAYEYHLFNRISLREFIADEFGGELLAAYDKLIPYAYKADLGRYCLAYKRGGWYADMSLKLLSAVHLNETIDTVYFYDMGDGLPSPYRTAHDCMNALFFAAAGNPILAEAIEMILRNCREDYYGISSLCPTGPVLFGKATAKYAPNEHHVFGHFMPLTPFHENKNRSFVAPNGSIIARHKSAWHSHRPSPGDLSVFGAQGTNNYFELWQSRGIYAS